MTGKMLVHDLKKIVNGHETTFVEGVSQSSTEGSSLNFSGRLSIVECDEIYFEVSQRKKNRTFGANSIEVFTNLQHLNPILNFRSYRGEFSFETGTLRDNARFRTMTDLLSIIVIDSPNLANAMRKRGLWLGRDIGIDDFDE
ncbi:unnamed protein product [Cochlearia groenlandica]